MRRKRDLAERDRMPLCGFSYFAHHFIDDLGELLTYLPISAARGFFKQPHLFGDVFSEDGQQAGAKGMTLARCFFAIERIVAKQCSNVVPGTTEASSVF